ncbi:MAG: MOSC domain-containing protein [Planctomycetes bacterium]|nr:MOSC domain-containing protein [Planctomycetota bacterium]
MRIVSVNTSAVRHVTRGERSYSTAIFKAAQTGPVGVHSLGLEGDDQSDKRHHGGPTQAVYALSTQEYDHWRSELNRDIPLGLMGENLSIDGLDDSTVCVGDIWRIGTVELQVTKTRAPCATLAMAMELPAFPKAFLARLRVGPYFRVLQEGTLCVGDEAKVLHKDTAGLTCPEVTRLMYLTNDERDAWKRAAAVDALCPKWKAKFLARADGDHSS